MSCPEDGVRNIEAYARRPMSPGSDTQPSTRHLDRILPEQLSPQLVRKLPLEYLKKQCALPITLEDGGVAVALSEPLNVEAYDAIMTVLGRWCSRMVCPAREIEQAILRCYYQSDGVGGDPESPEALSSMDDSDQAGAVGGGVHAEDLLSMANKAPVIKLVNNIFFQAVSRRASDIHVEMENVNASPALWVR